MPLLAIALLFCAAFLHTTWNLLLKGSPDKFIATWWAVLIGGIASLAVLLFIGLPPRETWPFVFFSVLVEAGYFTTLSFAYRSHDFSLVYPIARGAAPAFLALWSLLLLGEKPTVPGLAGLGLIICGLLIIGLGALARTGTRAVHFKGLALALTSAFFTSVYTAIDGTAVKHAPMLAYAFSVFGLLPLVISPLVIRQYRWPRLMEAWKAQWVQFLAIGLLGILAYVIALAAFSIAPLGYSGAIREVSVVMGALAGWRLLGENLGGWRVTGAVVIFAGILMIALLG